MKVIVAGGRNYQFTPESTAFLDHLHGLHNFTEVVSGGASGADKCGEEWARKNNLSLRVFNAVWKRYGKRAGPIRNKEMAQYADALVLFPGGAGSANMLYEGLSAGLAVYKYGPSKFTMLGGKNAGFSVSQHFPCLTDLDGIL